MKKVEVKVVIGSNYGDEGKGLATHYFASHASDICINVLFNGGCQRGHTVELKDGKRHVFHHFGSGAFTKATTYFDENFMLCPNVFIKECYELLGLGYSNLHCFASENCRVTTPYDMFINQIVELNRGDNRHGSCGFGIWETQKRYEDGRFALRYADMLSQSDDALRTYLRNIATIYVPERLHEYGIDEIPDPYKELINSDGLLEHFLSDLHTMGKWVDRWEFDDLVGVVIDESQYSEPAVIVFEGAQGLELDENNKAAYPNVTASSVTSLVPVQRVKDLPCNIEVCYITRSYFTRHGAGNLPTECDVSQINGDIEDKTNIFNDYQRTIRYGKFEKGEFFRRINKDKEASKAVRGDIKFTLFVTHLNYTNGDIAGNTTLEELGKSFDGMYLSDTKYAEDVRRA